MLWRRQIRRARITWGGWEGLRTGHAREELGLGALGLGTTVYDAATSHDGIDFPSIPAYTVNVYNTELEGQVTPGPPGIHPQSHLGRIRGSPRFREKPRSIGLPACLYQVVKVTVMMAGI